jgi:hypothetical protein
MMRMKSRKQPNMKTMIQWYLVLVICLILCFWSPVLMKPWASLSFSYIMVVVTGLNFSHRNSTQYGSLVSTRLSLASPFRSCFLRLCVSLTQKGSHNCLVVNKEQHKQAHREYKNTSQPLFISSTKDCTIRVCVLCTEIACYTTKALQPIYRQICELQGSPMISYFSGYNGHFLPHVLHDLSSLESTPVMLPRFAPMRLLLHPRSAPMMQPLHPHFACPHGSPNCLFCCVSCWRKRSII